MKIIIVDLETTGLDPKKHEIIEVGAVVFDAHTFVVERELDFKIRPTHIETADPVALKINGYSEEKWQDAVTLDYAIATLMDAGKDAIFCSFPLSFDYEFIRETGVPERFSRYKLDLFSLVFAAFREILSLKKTCEKLGIEPEPAEHRAINGARKGYEVFTKLWGA